MWNAGETEVADRIISAFPKAESLDKYVFLISGCKYEYQRSNRSDQ